MKIIYGHMATTPDDFIKQEIAEWGFDYVDEMFDKGYEPTLVNGVWIWNVQLLRIIHASDNDSCDAISSNSCNLVLSHNSVLTAESFLTGIAA